MSADMRDRLDRAVRELDHMACAPGVSRGEAIRLRGKIEGVKLAIDYLRADVAAPATPEAIKGDTPCHRCGSEDFPVWWTDSDFWNAVVRSAPLPWMVESEHPDGDGLMCFTCFAVLAYKRGFDIRGWVVSPVQIPTDPQVAP